MCQLPMLSPSKCGLKCIDFSYVLNVIERFIDQCVKEVLLYFNFGSHVSTHQPLKRSMLIFKSIFSPLHLDLGTVYE
jgi:hypothetical protein